MRIPRRVSAAPPCKIKVTHASCVMMLSPAPVAVAANPRSLHTLQHDGLEVLKPEHAATIITACSVYYFSPTKQKFRSKPEVYKHLTGQADPPKEKKEKGAPRASPRTRADLHLEAKKHLAKNAAHLPEIDKMKVRSLGAVPRTTLRWTAGRRRRPLPQKIAPPLTRASLLIALAVRLSHSVPAGELAARFHDTDKLFPVGYCTEWHHAAFNCVFISKILKSGDEGPLFRVRPPTAPRRCGAGGGRWWGHVCPEGQIARQNPFESQFSPLSDGRRR